MRWRPTCVLPRQARAWVFRLRDATFQNGEKVTSADVKWTIEQVTACLEEVDVTKEQVRELHGHLEVDPAAIRDEYRATIAARRSAMTKRLDPRVAPADSAPAAIASRSASQPGP